ncbi:MAG: hypothetical protein K8T89_21745 [Planctomycetes bacterium]|nr:hypothetical protein [Planctomycetota bacterium]
MKPLCSLLVLAFLLPLVATAQTFDDAKKKVEMRFEPAEAKPGQTVTLTIEVLLNEGWYTYAVFQPDKGAKSAATKIELPKSGDLIFVEDVQDPAGFKSKAEPDLDIKDQRYYPGGTTWQIKAVVSPKAKPGMQEIALPRMLVTCCKKEPDGKEFCIRTKTLMLTAGLKILEGPAVPVDPKYKDAVDAVLAAPAEPKKDVPEGKKENPSKSEVSSDEVEKIDVGRLIGRDSNYVADIKAAQDMLPQDVKGKYSSPQGSDSGFVALILTALFWGLVTLLTPCVFPMVPITVSYFLKQGEKKLHNPLVMATVYTLTIIVVLGVAALFFLATFRELSVDPWMNLALGLLFVFFALSLFGMYDIVLPSFLVRFTASRERKGGFGGVIFMALSFSIVSFTCVAPFLGGFAGMAASGQYSKIQLAAAAAAFAGAFAAPFFFLALFPSLLKKLPKSGGWMNTIKVVMGFLELAAALKFFRTAELRWSIPTFLFTYDFVLSLWVVILILSGLYLLSLYRLPHDEPLEHIGVPRMLFGVVSIGIGLYLIPGLLANGRDKQRPTGIIYAWVDAFLLPEPSTEELAWSGDLRGVIEDARAKSDAVFIDFTGVTCTNCRLNEKNVFPLPKIKENLKKYRLVQLYTDTVPPQLYESAPSEKQRKLDAAANLVLQQKIFGNEQLPLYVILKPVPGPKGSPVQILGVYGEGKINEVSKFEEFLRDGLKK